MWKDIKGWEELYEISDSGDVRNKTTGKLLIGDINNGGYYRVQLHNKNHIPVKQRFFRHRLVAEHFVPNPNNLPEVNHIDANQQHNYKENLEWIDKKGNELHSHKFGTKPYKPFKVFYKNGDIEAYEVKSDLSDKLNISVQTVKYWLHGKNKGYKNYNIESIMYI